MLKPTKKRGADKISINSNETIKKKASKLDPEPEVEKQTKFDGAARRPFSQKGGSKFEKGAKFDKNHKGSGFKSKGKFTTNASKGKPTQKFIKKNEVESKDGASEKKDWNKFKQEKKELRLKRKQSKDSYEITVEAKQLYEKLKCRRTEDKSKLVEKLYNLLSNDDTIKKIVMAHDTTRILQCMLKYASPAIRDKLSGKLLPHALNMCMSRYSHFCVLRMIKYGSPNIKFQLVQRLFGNIVNLTAYIISNKIIDHIYLNVATTQQKSHMRQEFYGNLYKKVKDNNVKHLSDTYKESSNMKSSILGAVKLNLERVANKYVVDNSLVHAVMLEYLQECDEDKTEEIVSEFAALIPLMLTTKEGTQAATICFYRSTPKHRRAIIKNIKEHLVKICTHEHGHVFLLAVLNSLDDTKATKKAIYDNIHPELQTLMSNQWGRRVIEWLIVPAETNCFHPSFIQSIEQGLQYGKKDKDIRRKEIFDQIEEPIAKAIAEQPKFWLSNSHIGLVTADILKKLSAPNFIKAATALVAVVVQPTWMVTIDDASSNAKEKKKGKKSQDVEQIISAASQARKLKQKKLQAKTTNKDANDDNNKEESNDSEADLDKEQLPAAESQTLTIAGIEEAGLHIVLKKIIKCDKERRAVDGATTFGTLLLQQLTTETLKYWLTVNRACFVLLNILEQNCDSEVECLKDLLHNPLQALLGQQETKGAQLLAKKLGC